MTDWTPAPSPCPHDLPLWARFIKVFFMKEKLIQHSLYIVNKHVSERAFGDLSLRVKVCPRDDTVWLFLFFFLFSIFI